MDDDMKTHSIEKNGQPSTSGGDTDHWRCRTPTQQATRQLK